MTIDSSDLICKAENNGAEHRSYFKDAATDATFNLIFDCLCRANGFNQIHHLLEREMCIRINGNNGKVERELLSNAFHDDAIVIHDIFVELAEAGMAPPTEKIGIGPKNWLA